jgi:hypothetical protein
MRKLFDYKATVILLALGGLIGLGLLAAALREVEFRPAGPLPFSFGEQEGPVQPQPVLRLPFVEVLVVVGLILFLIALVIALIDPKARKRLLLSILRFLLTLLALWFLMDFLGVGTNLGQEAPPGSPAEQAPAPSFVSDNQLQYTPPQVDPWILFFVSFVVALGIVVLAWWIVSHRSKARKLFGYDEIAEIARQSLTGLQDGYDWNDAIIRAYVRMSEAVTAERGLIRQPGTTPTEFAVRMERAGLPGEAARTLTRLFEQVRYGGVASGPQERDLAAAALSAILRACGGQTVIVDRV